MPRKVVRVHLLSASDCDTSVWRRLWCVRSTASSISGDAQLSSSARTRGMPAVAAAEKAPGSSRFFSLSDSLVRR